MLREVLEGLLRETRRTLDMRRGEDAYSIQRPPRKDRGRGKHARDPIAHEKDDSLTETAGDFLGEVLTDKEFERMRLVASKRTAVCEFCL